MSLAAILMHMYYAESLMQIYILHFQIKFGRGNLLTRYVCGGTATDEQELQK